MNYPGYRVQLNARFGKMRDRIQVDIGVGDVVDPVQIEWPFFQYKKQPLFEDFISLQVYPVETIFTIYFVQARCAHLNKGAIT